MAAFIIEAAGPFTTAQDLGRRGYERFGVPASGALDTFALRAANALVGNSPEMPGDAAVELGPGGLSGTLTDEGLLAVTGPESLTVRVNGRALPAWTALYVRAGQTISVELAGGWAYLALRGGLAVAQVMGARATYARGGFGGLEGRPLRAGDRLPVGPAAAPQSLVALAGRTLPPAARLPYPGPSAFTVDVILGPQLERFSHLALRTFLTAEYVISAASDRMGYRLSGPPLPPVNADLLSEALPLGAVQVPASGEPIIMLSDRPTVGGYPKIATVIQADLPLLVQGWPGAGRVRFRATTLAAAQARDRALWARLARIDEPEAEWD